MFINHKADVLRNDVFDGNVKYELIDDNKIRRSLRSMVF